ncbi:MAG: hypothetical protein SGILL_002257 [Bacillariaceae sp.]
MVSTDEHNVMSQLKKGMPIRWSALHICLPEGPFVKIHRAFLMLAFGQDARVRARVHPGMSLETQYKLLTFGINASEFPLTHSGSIKLKNHERWMKTRRVIDEARVQGRHFNGIVVPGVFDVLFSKGGNQHHHGNHEFKCAIESLLYQERYQNMFVSRKDRRIVDRSQREAIRQELITEVHARNGRFLALDEGGWWVELPSDSPDLLDKIATSVYDHHKRLEARKKQKKNKSDTGYFMESPIRHMHMDEDTQCDFRGCMS